MKVELLGPYKLGRMLGRGGMGAVYEGLDTESGLPVAVKILSVHLADAEGFRERFGAEVDTLKKLRHPGIVRLYAYGEQEGYRYYAMELVEGASLEEELRAGRKFDWQEVTRIGVRMCRALKHAHDHGVIHRDIKPANLLLSTNGEIKLSDFGIAKLFGATGLTSTGGVVGTAEYMAPEQADGRPVTQRSDLYSLGGVLYTLLARRPPLMAKTIVEMLDKQRHVDPEPVRRFAPDAPEELEQIIQELLAKDPDKRVRSAMILGRRLESMEHGLAHRAKKIQVNGSTMIDKVARPDDGEKRPGSVAATQVGTQHPARQEPSEPVDVHFSETMGSESLQDDGRIAPPVSAAAAAVVQEEPPAEPATKFTRVREEDQERDRLLTWSNPDGSLVSPSMAVPIIILVSLGVLGWYLLRPPSAESLYERIAAASSNGGVERLADVEGDIDNFLKYFPADPRRRELEDYKEDVTLFRLERRLERLAKRRGKEGELAPVESSYADAISLVDSNPELALEKLKALIDLYDDPVSMAESTRRCLSIAQRRMLRLEKQIEAHSRGQLAQLDQRLRRAAELAESDPEQSRRICRGVIELFRDKPWANEQVARAKEILASLP